MDRILKVAAATVILTAIGLSLTMFGMYEMNHVMLLNATRLMWLKTFFNGIFVLYLISIGMVIFFENRDPSKTLAWLLVLFLMPIVGLVFYLLIGGNYSYRIRARLKKKKNETRLSRAANIQLEIVDYIDLFGNNDSYVNHRLLTLLLNNSQAPFTINNKAEVLTNGDATYSSIIEAMESAHHHIHMEYFIIRNDEIGNIIKDIMIRKAQEGVKVRLIYDSVGCWKLGKRYIRDLKKAGVEAKAFFPVIIPILSRELNYRNHRKILVVDGTIGFVGGLNIGDEYLGKNPQLGFWRDTHLKISGEACFSLQDIFLNDWHYVSGQLVDDDAYFPQMANYGETVMQVTSSGPDADWKSILQAYFTMISTAEDKIWIATPYLVPEESIKMALRTAALCGKDVRIIIPDKPDHFFVYWASRDNIDDLLKAGVKIFIYKKGFIHSKVVLVDGISATVGTANLDIRSLEINFEVNAFIYDKGVVERLERDYLEDLGNSEELTLEKRASRPNLHKFLEALGRLVSPLQ